MDKYEYKLKLDHLKKLVDEKDYESAAQIADEINWKKVKSVNTLCTVGEIYENVRQYEESKDILLMAYDRSPMGRNIIYRLTLVTIKLGNLKEAQEYYEEFIEIAPRDNMKYVLRYELSKAKGESLDQQISILEEFKEKEYTEEWAFELAYLYHKNGMAEKCVDVCDELILWFGVGKYVEKALELKMMYQPLNKLQEEKYRRLKQEKEGGVEVTPEDELVSGEIVSQPMKIPDIQSDTSRFNTQNLQAELAKSMKQIMEATERETVTDTMDNIKRLANEISYLYMPVQRAKAQTDIEEEDEGYPKETEEEFDSEAEEWPEIEEPSQEEVLEWPEEPFPEPKEEVVPETTDPSLDIDFRNMFSEDHDGQIRLRLPQEPSHDLQITGQMSIQDILEEWERVKAAAQEAEQKKLEEVKQKALLEAEDIWERLAEALPEKEAVEPKASQELQEKQKPQQEEPKRTPERKEEPLASLPELKKEELEEFLVSKEKEPEVKQEPTVSKEDSEDRLGPVFLRKAMEQRAKVQEELEHQILQEQLLSHEVTPAVEPQISSEPMKRHLTAEQKEIFTYFTLISGMENQIFYALEGAREGKREREDSSTGNVVICGGKGSGKTVLAIDFAKAYQKLVGRERRGGKISASVLNQKDVADTFQKVEGGYLIIEKAGDLSRETVDKMSNLMEKNTKGLLVILEDDKGGIEKCLGRNADFSRKFSERIKIPIFSIDELVAFSRAYVREQDCEIEDMGVLALYNRINNIQKLDEATTLTEVQEILDGAIYKAQHGGLKKLFGRKRYSEEGRLLLQEKDFEE